MKGHLSPGKNANRARVERWLSFLLQAEEGTRNDALLTEYFLRELTVCPHLIGAFLARMRASLTTAKRPVVRLLAMRYLRILSPLCERFGLFREKTAMDTACFRIVDPRAYRSVDSLLSRYRRRSVRTIAAITQILRTLLEEEGVPSTVEGRYKNVYSIHRKLERKRYDDALELRDLFAFRIILADSESERCFAVLDLLHDRFQPVVHCFKDYVTIPKINGYQSLHTILNGVLPELDLPIEVQIRTAAMDEFAEQGLACHWLYAETKRSSLLTEKERALLSHFHSLSKAAAREHPVYCFTPTGDLLRLKCGATARDFAYRIHTGLGKRAVAAVINDRPNALDVPLMEGDRVRILSSPLLPVAHAS
ncbi:bifunctional (p)ppGpp synthetase/guanosine-3',5'-bis(diphosphate) 3'-pyrophosphohydrolase [Candidatus Peregrinibacteria bacterium]|nr:bifunctional (p)ppGpp synthetase/guanosine-3',5'-bis(diphosphate) 3'-pyrophosphohydrolase [Candidatus Peregrinibacteria bacterium]